MTDIANIRDESLSTAGLARISWAADFMPALHDAKQDVMSGALAGRRVGVVLTLEPKTANLALALAEVGAQVSVYCSAPHTTDSVAAALASEGIRVYARSDADPEMDLILRDRFVDDRIELLIDDGAGVTRYIHTDRRDALSDLLGVAEETTSGVRPLRVMEHEGALEVPCLAVNDALTKQLFDNVYGTGQSVVMTTLDVTNVQLQGKTVVVVGYGFVGKGIADTAHALGARVIITEIDPVRALRAAHDGYGVAKLDYVSPDGHIFFTATGIGYSLTADHMRRMRDGAIISVGGAGPPEVSLTGDQPLTLGDPVRPYVNSIPIDEDRTVLLVAEGECSNTSAGEGNPIEIMDLSLAVQLRAVNYLAENHSSLPPGVHSVPDDIDDLVAKSRLRALGGELDEPTTRQTAHAGSWNTDDHNQ